jgi:hypothetical protein
MTGTGIPGVAFDGAYDPNDLIATDKPQYTRTVTIAEGQVLPKGRTLGLVTDDEDDDFDKFVGSLKAATNGSQEIVGVLAEAVDASAGDVQALVYFAAGLKQNRLTFGTGHTKDNAWLAMSARGLFLYDDAAI